MNVGIMGATSHIAKGLIHNFLNRSSARLHLFSRSPHNVQRFLAESGLDEKGVCTIHTGYDNFLSLPYDLIINCIGVETRNKHNCDFTRYFSVTEEFDNLAIAYLKKERDTLYISFSSGAVYGKGFFTPVVDGSVNSISVNHMAPEDYYGIARINAEAKHRANSELRIIDLRIFSYFSKYINLADGYFITDVIQAILEDKVLVTDSNDIIRDYLHMDDLFAMIGKCVAAGRINAAFDVNSSRPVSKQEILGYFTSKYGLRYESRASAVNASATGAKSNYFSTCEHAVRLGFTPMYSSLDTVKLETEYILSQHQVINNEYRE